MSRYRLQPTPAQEQMLAEHCGHARFVWNLAVEQHRHWKPGRTSAPGFAEQRRQLTEARAESAWLRAGSVTVQQQALKDFAQAMANYFGQSHRKPTWRKRGQNEGFRIVAVRPGDVRRLSRKVGEVKIPKVGWVRFCWSRSVPHGAKSHRVTRDAAGRWHVAFAAIPEPIPAPGTGEVVGIDRGVAVSAALSTGELLTAPTLRQAEQERLARLLRKLSRAKRGSNRRVKVKLAVARLKARESDRRKDWIEKATTDLARRFRRDRRRKSQYFQHDQVCQRHPAGARPEYRGQGGLEPGHPGGRLGPTRGTSGAQGTRTGREDQPCIHEPALLGMRDRGCEGAREPSRLSVPILRIRRQRRRERGQEHTRYRRRACGGCAGTLRTAGADEPRTSP
ncbi:hypothetical protein GCM10020219_000890 [Nonomuraea dietziae]